jgi:hypothetical protein
MPQSPDIRLGGGSEEPLPVDLGEALEFIVRRADISQDGTVKA